MVFLTELNGARAEGNYTTSSPQPQVQTLLEQPENTRPQVLTDDSNNRGQQVSDNEHDSLNTAKYGVQVTPEGNSSGECTEGQRDDRTGLIEPEPVLQMVSGEEGCKTYICAEPGETTSAPLEHLMRLIPPLAE